MGRRGKRAGVKKPISKGLRTCAGCHEKFEPTRLLRVVADPDGGLWVDKFQRAPGRGVHLCYDRGCIDLAHQNRSVERSLKRSDVKWSVEEICRQLAAAIDERMNSNLSRAALLNLVVSGMDSLERRRRDIFGYLIAEDLAENSEKRVIGWAKHVPGGYIKLWSADLLGKSIGKLNRVAIGICDPEIWEKIVIDVNRRDRVLIAGCGR